MLKYLKYLKYLQYSQEYKVRPCIRKSTGGPSTNLVLWLSATAPFCSYHSMIKR